MSCDNVAQYNLENRSEQDRASALRLLENADSSQVVVKATKSVSADAGILPDLFVVAEVGKNELVEQLGSRSRTEREGAERALSLLGFEAIQELAKGTQSPDASIRKSCEKLFEQAWRPSAISQRLDEGNKLSLEMHNNKPNLTDKVYKLMSQIAETMDHPAGRGKYKQERLRQLDVVENLDQTGQVKLPRWQLDALRKERETLTNPDSEIKRVNANTKLHIAKALIWGGDSTTAKRYLLDAASKCPDVANSDEFLVKVIEGGLQHDKDFLAEFTRKGGSLDSLKTALAWVQPIPNDHPDGPRAPRRKK